MFICIDNKSARTELEIGKTYQLFKHETDHPRTVWVEIPDSTSTIGYKTIQCYRSDFRSVSEIRNDKIDKLLG
jgi:hypothetical protein